MGWGNANTGTGTQHGRTCAIQGDITGIVKGKKSKDAGFKEEGERMLRTSATGMNDMETNNREASGKGIDVIEQTW